ncbi:MAG: nitrogen fixation protein NifQ [Rhodocyclaceae bacterium]|nr:nitrogen fixation protein NifQ [Rhodocyclaceae bacterium]
MTDISEAKRIRRQADASRLSMTAHLMARAEVSPNSATLASLLAGWALGHGCLPADFGLGRDDFQGLIGTHFPGLVWRLPDDFAAAASPMRERALELDDLVALLQRHAADGIPGAPAIATVVAHGCLGSDHLWQDLGLAARGELSDLMQRNFPGLAARNDRDMKWKKFLYRQLCQEEGLFICRSPSCEQCSEFGDCFGPEA